MIIEEPQEDFYRLNACELHQESVARMNKKQIRRTLFQIFNTATYRKEQMKGRDEVEIVNEIGCCKCWLKFESNFKKHHMQN